MAQSITDHPNGALEDLDINVVPKSVSHPTRNTPHKVKRKQMEDDYTPRSRHVDKRSLPREDLCDTTLAEEDQKESPSNIVENDQDHCEEQESCGAQPEGARAAEDVFLVEETALDGTASIGSMISRSDLSEEHISDANATPVPSRHSRIMDHKLLPRLEKGLSDVQINEEACATKENERDCSITKVKNLASGSISGLEESNPGCESPQSTIRKVQPRTPLKYKSLDPTVPSEVRPTASLPTLTEQDLLFFQTPAPRRDAPMGSHIRRLISETGEEMLLDVTPRVYSPRSIPIYTLRDVDIIKAEFDEVRREQELKIQNLHEQLAQTVSHAVHHKALAVQGESLHSEYSKKHVRKVTALKADWERRTMEKLAVKDESLNEKIKIIQELEVALNQERVEKKEVIEMAEAVLRMANDPCD